MGRGRWYKEPNVTKAIRTRIKFCGFTRPEDLDAAVALGVDAVGLICVPDSKRFLTPAAAATLRRRVPPFVDAVLLLSNADAAWADAAIEAVEPDLVQFHGSESAAFCAGFGRRYLKSVAVRSAEDVRAAVRAHPHATGLLLDSHAPGGLGGTGLAFDWSQIPTDVALPLILAGGLNPENVGRAVRMCAPFAVDVSSGIESAPGRKDFQKMQAFVEAVRTADADANR